MLSIYFFPIWKGVSPRNSIWHFPSVKNENVSLTAVQRCHLWVCGWICLTTKIFNEFSIVWLCVFKLSSSLLLIYNSKPFHYWGPQAKLLKANSFCSKASRSPLHQYSIKISAEEQGSSTRHDTRLVCVLWTSGKGQA